MQKTSKDGFTITFKTPEDRHRFSEQSEFVCLLPRTVATVLIYDAPRELLDKAIQHRLSGYGKVVKIYIHTFLGYDHV